MYSKVHGASPGGGGLGTDAARGGEDAAQQQGSPSSRHTSHDACLSWCGLSLPQDCVATVLDVTTGRKLVYTGAVGVRAMQESFASAYGHRDAEVLFFVFELPAATPS